MRSHCRSAGIGSEKSAAQGFRTFPLLPLPSCGFVQAAELYMANSPDGMARIIHGVITGIGFIGGGAILKQGAMVKGTATAASLWATGAIGASVGLGSYDVAVAIADIHFCDAQGDHAAREYAHQ